MDKVFTSLAVSVDGFITGRNPGPGHGLGDGGILFGWYGDGDTRSHPPALPDREVREAMLEPDGERRG